MSETEDLRQIESDLAEAQSALCEMLGENVGETIDWLIELHTQRIVKYLEGMASFSVTHGYVDASSPHAAYRQGVEAAAQSIRLHFPTPPTQEHSNE